MQRGLVLAVSLLLTGVCANADLLTNGDLDNQTDGGPFIGLEFGHDVKDLGEEDKQYDAYANIFGWTGIDFGIEMQTFGEGSGPGAAQSGNLQAELDVGNYGDADSLLFGRNRHGGMEQAVEVTERGIYTLTFYYRARPDRPTELGNDRPGGTLSTYAIDVFAEGTRIGTADIGGSGSPDALVVKKQTGDYEWEMFSFDMLLDVGTRVVGVAAAGQADSFGGLVDTFSLELKEAAPIPEPATYLMLGMGLAGIYFLRRRQTKP